MLKNGYIYFFALILVAGASANPNVTIDFGSVVKTTPTNFMGFNDHLDYLGFPTYLDINGDGTNDGTSNVTWHRQKAVESGATLWRGDTRFSSKFAGLDQGILDYVTANGSVTGPITGSTSAVDGWTLTYNNIQYDFSWSTVANDGITVDVLNYTDDRFYPGSGLLVIQANSPVGTGNASLTQSVRAEANNGSAFNIHVTLYNGISSIRPNITTDATCLGSYSNNISGSSTTGWRQYSLTNCTKTANTAVFVSVNFQTFPLSAYQAVGSVFLEYDRTQETMIGWRAGSSNFGNINSDYDRLSYAFNETSAGRPHKVILTINHMPDEIALKDTTCLSDTKGCTYNHNRSWTHTLQSYIRRVTNNGQFCSVVQGIELLNEPDLTEYWLDDLSTGNSYRWQEYNDIYNISYYAIRNSVCPSVQIGGPVLASIVTSDGSNFINSFLGNFTSTNQYDFVSYHRYPSATESDIGASARSIETTFNTTRTLFNTYNVNRSRICVQLNELNENRQNIVQNLSSLAFASYMAMMAQITNDPLCLQLTWYQWADDSPWGTAAAEGNSSGIFRIALQEPQLGERYYALYNASKDFFNKVPGGSVVYNTSDNETQLFSVAVLNASQRRFGIVNTRNATISISLNFNNSLGSAFYNERNGTVYNLTGSAIKTATVAGIAPYTTEWFLMNESFIYIANGTCYATSTVNYCFNTDAYAFNNVTINGTVFTIDQWVFNITTNTGTVNFTFNSFDTYGTNTVTLVSNSPGNFITQQIRTNTNNYSFVYGTSGYAYGNSFSVSGTPTASYYTLLPVSNNEWFVEARNSVSSLNLNSFNVTVSGVTHATNNASILFNGLHDSSGNNRTLTKGDCFAYNGYLDCFDPTTNPRIDETTDIFNNNNTWSISLWARPYSISPNGTPDTILFLSRDNGATGNNSAVTIRTQNNTRLVLTFRNGSNATETYDLASINTGTWHHIAVTYNGSVLLGYYNGVVTVNRTRTFFGFGSNNATFAGLGNGEKYSGGIGVTSFYNTALTASQVTTLYGSNATPSYSGLRAFYPFTVFTPASIVLATGSASSYNSSTVNASTGTPYIFSLGPIFTAARLDVREFISNNAISNYTIQLVGISSGNYTVNSTNYVVNLTYGTYNYTVSKNGYYNLSGSFTAQNGSQNVTISGMYSFLLNVTYANSVTSTNLTNFSVNISSGLYYYTNVYNTTNGSVIIPYIRDTNFNITGFNGANTSNVLITTNTTNVTNATTLNYRLVGALPNSVYFFFFDEATQNRLNGTNVTIYLTGTVYTVTFTEDDGNYTLNNVPSGSYVVTAQATGYTTREYSFTLAQENTAEQNIYLLGNSSGTYIRFTALDQSYTVLQQATINAQRKNISGTGYYEVGDCTTDNNGECLINLQTFTATYRFVACFGDVCQTTADTVLSRDTYTIVINLETNTLREVFERQNIIAGLTYDNNTRTFSYTVVDSNNNAQDAYVLVSRRVGFTETVLGTVSGSGSSVTITTAEVNSSLGDATIARGYILVDNQPVLTHVTTVTNNRLQAGRTASILLLVVGLAVTAILIFSWNPVAPPLIFGVILFIFQSVGLVQMGAEAIVSILIIVGLSIYRMRNV